MPTRIFIPTREPPLLWDRLRVHPFSNPTAFLFIVSGLLLIVGGLYPDFAASPAMAMTPWVLELFTGGLLLSGGILVLTGLHWSGETVSRGWHIERMGWAFVAGGLVSYSIPVFNIYPNSVFSWLWPLCFTVGAVMRILALRAIEQSTRKMVKEVEDRAD